jgi:hypothetical protein
MRGFVPLSDSNELPSAFPEIVDARGPYPEGDFMGRLFSRSSRCRAWSRVMHDATRCLVGTVLLVLTVTSCKRGSGELASPPPTGVDAQTDATDAVTENVTCHPPREHDPCDPSDYPEGTCTEDGAALLTCKSGQYVLGSICRGPSRCAFRGALGGSYSCDTSIGEPGDVCLGGATCTRDRTSTLLCQDGQLVAKACAAGWTCSQQQVSGRNNEPFTETAPCRTGDSGHRR